MIKPPNFMEINSKGQKKPREFVSFNNLNKHKALWNALQA